MILEKIIYCLYKESAQELLTYLNQILDFSELEEQRTTVLLQNFNLRELVESILLLEKPAAKLKNLQLKLNYDAKLSEVIRGDAPRLKRILINLLSNAIKFTDFGHIQLGVQLAATSPCAKMVTIEFTVKDTGIGIPSDKKKIIFEKFVRLTSANQEKYKGQGLGLYIVQLLVSELSGKITVKSKAKKGSLFTCQLPFDLILTTKKIKAT